VDDTSCPATAPLCDGTSRQCTADLSSIEGGGCSCSTVPSGGTKTLPVLVGLGLAVTALVRRRRNAGAGAGAGQR
jgi:MYXO-CTERM domain-containing protein